MPAADAPAAQPAAQPAAPPELLALLYLRPGFLLRRAHQLSVGLFEEGCKAVALTPSQYRVLTIIGQTSGCAQATVACALGFDRVTALRVVRGLQARGLLANPATGESSRRRPLALPAAGRQTLAQAQARSLVEQVSQRLMAPLDAAEQVLLRQLLRKLCAGLEPVARTRVLPPGC